MNIKKLVKEFKVRARLLDNDPTFDDEDYNDNVFALVGIDLELDAHALHDPVEKMIQKLERGPEFEWQREDYPLLVKEAIEMLRRA